MGTCCAKQSGTTDFHDAATFFRQHSNLRLSLQSEMTDDQREGLSFEKLIRKKMGEEYLKTFSADCDVINKIELICVLGSGNFA